MKRRGFLGLMAGAAASGRQATAAIVSKAGIDMKGIATAAANGPANSVGLEMEVGSINANNPKKTVAKLLKMRALGLPKGIKEKAWTASRSVSHIDVDIGSLRSISPSHMLLMQRHRSYAEMIDLDTHIKKMVHEEAMKAFNEKNESSIWFW
jgi:hypothetical protein